ncbi:bis(5'-nucleosyl)-tetraphosphatase (symmetrical) YqeK [Virgibacillus xinjiangensis]|uniref:bis(5'-nucleosyl)-tetraphosphatase (symmetrical) n=1 Tax=Virgibacillus xinjiangensis TaxID=393090 RepID=A0ABV7CRT9_9BACI
MRISEAKEQVRPLLTKDRYDHSLRVAETAVVLAERYGVPADKAELAAVWHDHAKYRPKEELKHFIANSSLPQDLLEYHHELWHGPVGALLLEDEYGLKDRDIQNAVHYHTTGRANMTKMEMVIFLADYIEPGRAFPGVQEVREAAGTDLVRACWMAAKNTIHFLTNKQALVYPDTFHAYNDLTRKLTGGL